MNVKQGLLRSNYSIHSNSNCARLRLGFLGRGGRRRCHEVVGGRVVARVRGGRLALLCDEFGLELVDALRLRRGRRRGGFGQFGSDLLLLRLGGGNNRNIPTKSGLSTPKNETNRANTHETDRRCDKLGGAFDRASSLLFDLARGALFARALIALLLRQKVLSAFEGQIDLRDERAECQIRNWQSESVGFRQREMKTLNIRTENIKS